MIPPFDERGNLPPGVHLATLDEIEARFGRESEVRRTQMESLRWLVELSNRSGVTRLVINGSFVTNTIEPNDVDCAILIGPDFPKDTIAEEELQMGLPFLDIEIAYEADFDFLVTRFFATDRRTLAKGMIEVEL